MHGFDTLVLQFVTRVRGTCIVVTPDLISDLLHVLRVAHLDYPSCDRLCPKTISRLFSVRYLHLGVTVKTPFARALQKV